MMEINEQRPNHSQLQDLSQNLENIVSEPVKAEDYTEISFGLTSDDIEILDRAKKMPITFDEDCPETTPERGRKFHRVNPPRTTESTHVLTGEEKNE